MGEFIFVVCKWWIDRELDQREAMEVSIHFACRILWAGIGELPAQDQQL